MKKHNSKWFALAALLAGLGMTSNAHAVWTFANTTVTSTTKFNDYTTDANGAVTTTQTSSGITVGLSAISAVNSTFTGTGTWSAATLTNQGSLGQGICSVNDSSPTTNTCPSSTGEHAVDNTSNTEAILLNFSSSVVLSSIGLGWTNGSSTTDISLFRWIGTGTPTGTPTALIGQDANSMTGWELVGNYGSMAVDTSNPYNVVNTGKTGTSTASPGAVSGAVGGAGGLGSSWWMISAYNSGYTATAKETLGTGFDTGNDYFKLYGVAGTKCTSTVAGVCGPGQAGSTVPEPGSLALASLALFGVIYTRRKVQAKR